LRIRQYEDSGHCWRGLWANTVTQEGLRAIEQADALIGGAAPYKEFAVKGKEVYTEYVPERVAQIVGESAQRRFAVLVSGDTGFYSAADKLSAALSEHTPSLIPGVSSLSCFFARLKRPWQDAALVSCHGRTANLVDTVRRNELSFV
jgi:precorrin-6Y C5,15-methyltransferase (decarboxylating)